MSSSGVSEADAFMRSAAKHLEKGLFKWKPNWDEAASDYEKAAKIYSHANIITKAREAWSKASQAHEKAGNSFYAARAMESLALFLAEEVQKRDNNNNNNNNNSLLNDAIETYTAASKLFAIDGKFDRQADVLTKAAQLLYPINTSTSSNNSVLNSPEHKKNIQRVSEFLKQAIEVLEEHEDEQRSYATRLPDIYRTLMLIHLRSNNISEAVSVLEQQVGFYKTNRKKGLFERLGQPRNGAKVVLEIIVLCLYHADVVWARQEIEKLREVPGFANSHEESIARLLLSCFEERDVEQLQEAVKEQTLQFITADISRMAKKLTIQSSETTAVNKSVPFSGKEEPDIDPEEDIR